MKSKYLQSQSAEDLPHAFGTALMMLLAPRLGPLPVDDQHKCWPQQGGTTHQGACTMAFKVAGGRHIGTETSIRIGSSNCSFLGFRAWIGNTWCPSIAVCGRSADDGSDRITVSDSIPQPFHIDCVDSLRFGVPVRLGVERVTFAR